MKDKLVLVADDEKTIRESLAKVLGESGYKVATAGDGLQALRMLEETGFDVALLDIRMPGLDGLQVLARARQLCPETQVVLITAFGSVESAVEAVKMGAGDYITKPFVFDDVLIKVDRLLGLRRLARENRALRGELRTRNGFEGLVGESPALLAVLQTVRKLAQTRSSALITGESGTGKELVARAIHYNGITAAGRFLPINCAALPEGLAESELFGHTRGAFTGAAKDKPGLFEQADGGTLLFDEICSMPLSIQPKLLRAIEEKVITPIGGHRPIEVNVRVLCAANCDLAAEVQAGRFRGDLYYRLNIVELHLPPLRRRTEDIPALARHFMEMSCREFGKPCPGFSGHALQAMTHYAWPGNIREMRNVIERAIILGDGRTIQPEDLAFASHAPPVLASNLKSAMRTSERLHLLRALQEHHFDKNATARALQIALSSLYRKMDELGISARAADHASGQAEPVEAN